MSEAAVARFQPGEGFPSDLAHKSLRLRQYLKWAAPPNLLAAAALFTLYRIYGNTLVLVLGVMVFLNAVLAVVANGLAGANRVEAGAFCVAGGLWAIAFGLSLAGPPVLPVTVMCSLIPIPAASPYVSTRALLTMCLVSTGLVIVGVVLVLVGAPLPLDEQPADVLRIFVCVGIPVLTAVCGLSILHNRVTLHETDLRLETANRELLESERSLARRVRERTAELEESEREGTVARDAALEANRQKSRFLARMSHELRTPLNAIIGFSEVLGDRTFGELNDKQAEYLGDIHASGQHLLALINDILDLARVESGELRLEPSIFDLEPTIEKAFVLVRERAQRQGVALEREIDPAVGEIAADERRIRQVMINLLTNAVKFTPRGGAVQLRAARSAGALTISIADTGVGISEADREIIFEEFGQAKDPSAREQEGTGLGLPFSKRVIELHGGRIWVESEPGRGSVFWFTIPDPSAGVEPRKEVDIA